MVTNQFPWITSRCVREYKVVWALGNKLEGGGPDFTPNNNNDDDDIIAATNNNNKTDRNNNGNGNSQCFFIAGMTCLAS